MILLSLISVALLSLSSVTLRASNNQEAATEARANARMALSIALGELQRLAGPDQRITAIANIAGDDIGEALSGGAGPQNNSSLDGSNKGLTGIQPGTRQWTGVFINNDDPNQIYRKTPSASLEGWLVSNPLGQTSTGTTAINPGNSTYQANADGTASDSSAGIVLVGRNTFGNASAGEDNYVVAPLVTINNNNNEQTGSYAWWIGDENVKSQINRSILQTNNNNFATLAPQRRGWEVVDGIAAYPEASDANQNSLQRIATLPSSELILDNEPSFLTSVGTYTESLFHSATAFSQGLHTNALDGGLKVDLSSALANGLPNANSNSSLDNFPSRDNPIIPSLATTQPLNFLTWERLLPFYERIQNTGLNQALQVGVDTSTSGGGSYAIAPTILEFRLLLGARVTESGGGRRGSDTIVNPCAKVAFVIANPYSRPLRWSGNLDFQFRNMTPIVSGVDRRTSRLWQTGEESAFFPENETPEQSGSEAAVFNQATFQIRSGTLNPGEARVYTMGAPVSRSQSETRSPISINLVPASSTELDSFVNCLEMVTTTPRTLPITLDVRERQNTTLIQLEMRAEGIPVRRISGIELNNTDWRLSQKRWDQPLTDPSPLILYKFQMSQPGVDYLNKLPGGSVVGQRASALRTFADYNLQATNFDAPITSYTPPPYFFENVDNANQIGGSNPAGTEGLTGSGFTLDLNDDPLPWGFSPLGGSQRTVLFTIPEALSSLGQLQHLDLTADDTKVSIAHQPAYAVGNSYATPFVRRSLIEQSRNDYLVTGFGNATSSPRNYYDITHLLNSSLWDRFFFSTIDNSQEAPLNPNQVLLPSINTNNLDASTAAASIVNSGMFNINSTSVSAWKAFLASSRNHITSVGGNSNRITFPRSLQQPSQAIDNPTGSEEDSFSGNRVLSDQEIDTLARNIVRQVRRRGPFVSLSHFVNRALADASAEPDLTRSGALQFALDESRINIDSNGSSSPFSDIVLPDDQASFAFNGVDPLAARPGGGSPPPSVGSDPDWASGALDRNFKSLSSIVADREIVGARRGGSNSSNAFGFRSTSIPAWVNQADILQLLGPSMSVRSDTFRIRTCGRSHDASGRVVATAFAEALVQRSTDFIDPANASNDNIDSLNTTNQRFGRRFEIVSFRWLADNEI